ncbi:aldo/keto reductase [Salibacterium aidingense]|uniref:aldo/keto reductase n=1 Tax=Salibacterium aidingense TaxID=384933 RepID=UPI00041A0166|nr:aldo/keto reductase [Salibacterium aidingense]
MKYNRLGNTGLKVSALSFGTMTFGDDWNIGFEDQKRADQMVDMAIDAGINLFDTADVYSYGVSEEMLGKAVKNRRQNLILATKVMGSMSDEVNDRGLSRFHMMNSVENSLRRLDTDYIDLYQLHSFDNNTPLEETLRTLEDLVNQGKVRYIGMSNHAAWQMAKGLGISDKNGWPRYASAQMHYSLINRDIEHEVVPLAKEEGMGILVWSPLNGGYLTGKYRKGEDEDSRFATSDLQDFPPIPDIKVANEIVDKLTEIGSNHNVGPAEVALAWLMDRPGVASVLIGSRKTEQLKANLKAAEIELSQDEYDTLTEISEPRTPYPQWMLNLNM